MENENSEIILYTPKNTRNMNCILCQNDLSENTIFFIYRGLILCCNCFNKNIELGNRFLFL